VFTLEICVLSSRIKQAGIIYIYIRKPKYVINALKKCGTFSFKEEESREEQQRHLARGNGRASKSKKKM
jgi:hypothetical protein